MTTVVVREYTSAATAAFLARHLHDRRDYTLLLQDQRRGRRRSSIPFHTDARGRVFYFEPDLLLYVDRELARGVAARPEFTERKVDDDGFISLHPFYLPV
jgi:hypothetical protein